MGEEAERRKSKVVVNHTAGQPFCIPKCRVVSSPINMQLVRVNKRTPERKLFVFV
jgi:hypothetical protein